MEAALVLTLVIFSWTALITLFSAMQIHIKLRCAMEQAAEEFAMLAYLTEMVETDVSPEDIGGMVSSYDVGAYLRSVMDEPASSGEVGGWETDWNGVLQAGVTALVLRSRILTLVGRDTLDDSCIRGGSQGITLLGSSGLTEEGDIDICLTYQIEIPFVPFPFSGMIMTQRVIRHAWIGALPSDSSGDGDGVAGESVYVTTNGTVYHESASCTYLKLSVRPVSLDSVEYLRSADGSRYYPCERCMSGAGEGTVYITSEGNRYHHDTGCSSLKRTVETVEKSETNLPACSKCCSGED